MSKVKVRPKLIVFPKTESEIIDVINYATKHKLSIAVRGGGSGLSGAATGRGIIIDTKYLNKISEDTIQAGVFLKKLRKKLKNKTIPSTPLHGYCTVGGILNTNSLGPNTIYFGPLLDYVTRIKGITANGEKLDTAKPAKELLIKLNDIKKEIKNSKRLMKVIKKRPVNAGGYNLRSFLRLTQKKMLHALLIGSAGTLLIFTEITFDLPKRPKNLNTYIIPFSQRTLNRLIKQKPYSLEYANEEVMSVWPKKFRRDSPVLIVQSDKRIGDKLSPHDEERLWKARELSLISLGKKAKRKKLKIVQDLDDITFHPKDADGIITAFNKYFERFALYGHIGIGCLHLRPFVRTSNKRIHRDIFKIVNKYNGTLVGEHNIGPVKTKFIKWESLELYRAMKKIKRVFDPTNILNPDVLK